MSRPVGITASAVVAMLWSILTLLLGAGLVASVFIEPQQAQPPNSTQFALAGAAMMAAFSGVGIWTAIGLFRLRRWARISILVFAGFTAVWSIFGFFMTRIVPLPPEMTARGLHIFRLVIGAMFGIPLAISVWWLIQFNMPSTKAAFASPLPEAVPGRPLSITVIGWISILGILSCLLMILTRQPAFLLGATFTGWIAIVIYLFFGALSLYIGKGLLDLDERARIVALGWFGLMFVHMSLVAFVPSIRQRLLELQRAVAPRQSNPIAIDQDMLMNVTFGFTAIFVAAAIWFLVRNRAAFVRPGTPVVTGYNT